MFRNYQVSEHILLLIETLERAVSTPNSRLIVTMPPRHSKSLNVSEHLPAWYLGNNPNNRVIAASHMQDLANVFSRRARNKLMDPRWPFPLVKLAGDKSKVERWDLAGYRGGYVCVGVGGSPTGEGADLMIIDDPIRNQQDADSLTVREAIWEWWTGTMRTRLEPGASVILTATRWHEDDLTGRLLKQSEEGDGEEWEHLHLPAINEFGDALWPERWPLQNLETTRTAIGERKWQAQYQGVPVDKKGGTFKSAWWKEYTELPHLSRLEIFVDSAFKTGVSNDWSAFAVWGKDLYGSIYLIRVWRDRMEFPKLILTGHEVMAWCKEKFPNVSPLLVVEDKASGQSAIQMWSNPYFTESGTYPALSVAPFKVPSEQSKLYRAESATPFIEGGRVFVPKSAQWLGAWRNEHDAYPTGTYDDQVDTTSMAVSRLLGTVTPKSWGDIGDDEDFGFSDFLQEAGVA